MKDERQRYLDISDKIVILRDEINRLDPEYFDKWLAEFVHSPEVALDRIIL